MKKFTLSVAAVMAMGTFAIAGGDIAPVEPVVEAPAVQSSILDNFYVGVGYSTLKMYHKSDNDYTLDFDGYMLFAGYEFSKYAAAELRYYKTTEHNNPEYTSNDETKVQSTGLYIKGMYPIGDFTPYAFIGAAQTKITPPKHDPSYWHSTNTTLGYGLGLSYSVTENIGVFVDYMYNNIGSYQDAPADTNGWHNLDLSATTFGVTYKF